MGIPHVASSIQFTSKKITGQYQLQWIPGPLTTTNVLPVSYASIVIAGICTDASRGIYYWSLYFDCVAFVLIVQWLTIFDLVVSVLMRLDVTWTLYLIVPCDSILGPLLKSFLLCRLYCIMNMHLFDMTNGNSTCSFVHTVYKWEDEGSRPPGSRPNDQGLGWIPGHLTTIGQSTPGT